MDLILNGMKYKLSYTAKLSKNNSTISERKQAITIQRFNNYHRGFTLIELLIVTLLIGILTSVGIFTYSSAQAKARDSRRKQDLNDIKKALELAREDTPGSYYPPCDGTPNPNYCDVKTISPNNPGQNLASQGYMKDVPQDPLGLHSGNCFNAYQSTNYTYCYTASPAASPTSYALTACLENKKEPLEDSVKDVTATGNCPSNRTLYITNPQ